MNKEITLALFVLSSLLIAGCSNLGQVDLSNLSEEDVNKIIKCDKPYMRFGTGCCLDQNDNKICDSDENGKIESPIESEKEEEKIQVSLDEISGYNIGAAGAQGNFIRFTIKENGIIKLLSEVCNNDYSKCSYNLIIDNERYPLSVEGAWSGIYLMYYCKMGSCLRDKFGKKFTATLEIQKEGIKYQDAKEISIGEDKQPPQIITCKDECTQDSCDVNIYYQCVKQADGCYDKINKGKMIGKCDVNCLKDSDCASGQECYYSGLNQFYVCQDKQPSQAGYDLSNYPEPFINFNNKKFDYIGVIGADSAAIDNLALNDITAGLTSTKVNGELITKFDTAPSAVLDIEVATPSEHNLILVGSPSVNRLVAQYMGLTYPAYGAASGLQEGEAIISLKDNGNKVALVVAGWQGEDTRRAAVVLKNYEAYKDGLKGTEVRVTGTTAHPTII